MQSESTSNPTQTAQQDESRQPHSIRITSSGKITLWVEFALKFFQDEQNEGRPLALHTSRPAAAVPSAVAKQPNAEEPTEPVPPTKSKAILPSKRDAETNTIPRLISVAEIIKREYLKTLSPSDDDKKKVMGLYQYNEIRLVEDDSEERGEGPTREEEILYALSAKNHIKRKQTPYMQITLCKTELPEVVARGATAQPRMIRKISKSAQARAKKREKRKADKVNEPDDGGGGARKMKKKKKMPVASGDGMDVDATSV